MLLRKTDELKDGDVFAADLLNAQGVALVRAGTPFREPHRRLMKTWGVEAARVHDGSAGGASPGESALDAAEAEIKRRFGASVDNDIMAEILHAAVEQRAARQYAGRTT